MAKTGNTGLKRILLAGVYSCNGFKACYRYEAAFRQELALTLLVVPLAFWLGQSGLERAVLIGVWLIVPLVELLNSGIEAVVDLVSEDHHPLAERAKDLGSAAVFLAIANAAVVWAILLFA